MTDRAPVVALIPPLASSDGVFVFVGWTRLHLCAVGDDARSLCGRWGYLFMPVDLVEFDGLPMPPGRCCQRCRQILEGRRVARAAAVQSEQEGGIL